MTFALAILEKVLLFYLKGDLFGSPVSWTHVLKKMMKSYESALSEQVFTATVLFHVLYGEFIYMTCCKREDFSLFV